MNIQNISNHTDDVVLLEDDVGQGELKKQKPQTKKNKDDPLYKERTLLAKIKNFQLATPKETKAKQQLAIDLEQNIQQIDRVLRIINEKKESYMSKCQHLKDQIEKESSIQAAKDNNPFTDVNLYQENMAPKVYEEILNNPSHSSDVNSFISFLCNPQSNPNKVFKDNVEIKVSNTVASGAKRFQRILGLNQQENSVNESGYCLLGNSFIDEPNNKDNNNIDKNNNSLMVNNNKNLENEKINEIDIDVEMKNEEEDFTDFNNMENCYGVFHFNSHEIQPGTQHKENKFNENNNINSKVEEEDITLSKKENPINDNAFNEKYNILAKKKNKKQKKKKKKKKNDSDSDIEEKEEEEDTIETNNIPIPDIDNYDENKLKEALKQFGMKSNISTRTMRNTLKDIYIFISKGILPEQLKTDITNFTNEDESKKKGTKERGIFISKGKLSDLSEEIITSITEAMKSDKKLWTKILLFKTIDIDEVKEALNKSEVKILIPNNILKELLSGMGCVFSGGWERKNNKKEEDNKEG